MLGRDRRQRALQWPQPPRTLLWRDKTASSIRPIRPTPAAPSRPLCAVARSSSYFCHRFGWVPGPLRAGSHGALRRGGRARRARSQAGPAPSIRIKLRPLASRSTWAGSNTPPHASPSAGHVASPTSATIGSATRPNPPAVDKDRVFRSLSVSARTFFVG